MLYAVTLKFETFFVIVLFLHKTHSGKVASSPLGGRHHVLILRGGRVWGWQRE